MKSEQLDEARKDRLARRMRQLNHLMMRIEGGVAVSLLAVLLVAMCVQVIARYVFRSPFSWSEELARFAMIWLTFVAAALVMARREHITVDLWVGGSGWKMPRPIGLALDYLVDLVIIATCLLLLLGGFRFVWYVHPVGSPALGIPKSVWYGAVSTGLALMALHSLLHLVLALVGHTREDSDRRETA